MFTPESAVKVWEGSLPGRITARIKSYSKTSFISGWFSGSAHYEKQAAVDNSMSSRALAGLVAPFKKILLAGSKTVHNWTVGSSIANIEIPKPLNGSTTYKTVSAIKAEWLLYPLVLYVLMDHLLRVLPYTAPYASLWDEFLFVLIAVAWPLQMAWRGKLSWRLTPMDVPIFVFLAIAVFLFLVRSPDTGIAVEGMRVYVQYMLWFFVGSNLISNKKQLRGLLNLLLVAGMLVALHGIYQYVVGVEMPAGWVDSAEAGVRTRVFSIAGNPNALGCLMTLLIPLSISHFLTARNRLLEIWYAGCAGAMLLCLIFTFSRGAWFAFAGAMALYSFMYMPLLLAAITAGVAAAPIFVPGIVNRITYLFSPAYMVSSARAGRIARWDMALGKVSNNPLTGDGFGRFGGAVADRYIQSSVYVDNFYLKTAAETGIIGIAVLVWLLLNGVRCAINAFRRVAGDRYLRGIAAGITAGLVGVLLHNFVENIFEVPMLATYFWFLLGAMAAMPHLEGNRKKAGVD